MSGTWASGWVTGDIVTANEFRKGVGAIYDSTLSGAASSFDIPGIVGGYAHLLIEVNGRGDTAASTINCNVRLNNDTAGNYYYQRLRGNGATASAAEGLAQTAYLAGFLPAASAPAGIGGSVRMRIPSYSSSALTKGLESASSTAVALSTGNLFVDQIMGVWNNAAAVTRVTVLASVGNFAIGTRLTVYAMGA